MDQDKHELTKSEEWFRDRLNDFLGYGVAAFTVIIGWLLSNDSLISLTEKNSADKREAAIALGVIIPILWTAWYVVLLRLHARCPTHPTVIGKRYVHIYAIVVGVALAAIWGLAADIL